MSNNPNTQLPVEVEYNIRHINNYNSELKVINEMVAKGYKLIAVSPYSSGNSLYFERVKPLTAYATKMHRAEQEIEALKQHANKLFEQNKELGIKLIGAQYPRIGWVKANERLPKEAGQITWRWLDKEAAYSGFDGTAFVYDKGGARVDMLYAIEIEWLDESASPAAGREEDAGVFAEWLYMNRWFSFENGKWYYTFEQGTCMSDKQYQKEYVKSTAQLYELFKQQREKR